jgi:hypothetical protein
MISCNKCGFSHRTFEELNACKSWDEIVADCERDNHPIIRRDLHGGEREYCICGKMSEPRDLQNPVRNTE